MPQKSQIYNLEYFRKGDYYSSESDFHRFVTLDYNLESYIGILGNGVLDGWTVSEVSGTTIQVAAGRGIINGFFAESPYTVKLRSQLTGSDVEVDILTDDGVPESDPQNDQVKAVVPTQIVLPDDSDLYVYAERPSSALPYPQMLDYPTRTLPLPVRVDYSTYAAYNAALSAWQAEIDAINAYKWWDNSDNHFTAVTFGYSTSAVMPSNRVLIARVSTRSGSISKIDVSNVQDLGNFRGPIERAAKTLIAGHHHGGDGEFDPPKVRLETDVRDTVLSGFDSESGVASFKILDKLETTVAENHKHKYVLDSSGDGITYDIVGTAEPHYHDIVSLEVQNQEGGLTIADHVHELSNTSSSASLNADSEFVIYVDGVIYGDQTSPNISLSRDYSSVVITGVSIPLRLFSVEFDVSGRTYTYEKRTWSVFNFMISMINDFNSEFYGVIENIEDNPFLFATDDGTGLEGLADLEAQSETAEFLLKEDGDEFTFTPNAARNITIVLKTAQVIPEVKIEVLGDVEVQGILSTDNIAYIHAEKFLIGEFSIDVIPFVSHVGRLREAFTPVQNSLISNDGFSYSVSPTITSTSSGHYHTLYLDTNQDGFTVNTIVDGDPVLYADGQDGDTYFIGHRHSVNDGVVADVASEGVTSWQDDVNDTTSATNAESHTHTITLPVTGDRKIVYSVREDANGHMYVGTSDGFIMVANAASYSFTINDYQYYFSGDDLWELLLDAKAQYEKDTGDELPVLANTYSLQIAYATNAISSSGDSYLLVGEEEADGRDQIMIQKVSDFRVPNFSYSAVKNKNDVVDSEVVVGEGEDDNTVIVERDFSNVSVWSSTMQNFVNIESSNEVVNGYSNFITTSLDVYAVGADTIVKNSDLYNDYYKNWTAVELPYSIGAATKIFKDANNNKWLASESGLFVLRDHQLDGQFTSVYLPVTNPSVHDIVEGNIDSIYVATSSGVLKTTDEGKTWSTILTHSGGFKQIIRDYANDRTDTSSGHYHTLDVNIFGDGELSISIGANVASHTHTVSSYAVATTLSHTHTYVIRLFAVANDGTIYRSLNSGTTWTSFGLLPDGECGDVFVAFNTLFVSQSDGTYRSTNGTTWTKILTHRAYSYNWSHDMSKFYVGGNNIIYESSNGASFGITHEFEGSITPILVENDVKKYFGYAYNNQSRSFYLKERFIPSSDNVITALVDLDTWSATNGKWSSSSPYDIYVDYRLVLSTKTDVDTRAENEYYFNVSPDNGLLDFRVEAVSTEALTVYDNTLVVDDGTGFLANDRILIESGETRLYRTIETITGNTFGLATRATIPVPSGANVYKLSEVGADLNVIGNIYESTLGNTGEFTHEELEDRFGNYADGRPYQLNDSYLGSLMNLTQTLRANTTYTNVHTEFINSVLYDFVYSESGSPYPDIDDYIDVQLSDVFSQTIFRSNFSGKEARQINKVVVYGGNIYVATDIGIFWAKYYTNFEGTWFYIHELQQPVYDLMFSTDNKMMAATGDGVYLSSNAVSWTLETDAAVSFPTYGFSLRWKKDDIVEIAAHDADFVKDATNNTATITATSASPYGDLQENRTIKITIDGGDKDGNYTVLDINSTSEITVSPAFSGIDESKSNVTMVMGTWWQQFENEVNTLNANIENTLIAGGEGRIAFNLNDSSFVWREASISGTSSSDFIVQNFEPLSSGRMLSFASGIDDSDTSYILTTTGIGSNWSKYYTFERVEGTVDSSKISKFNHTMIEASFTYPNNYVYKDGLLAQRNITIYAGGLVDSIYSGEIIDNQNIDGVNQILVFGPELADLMNENISYTFVIDPIKIKTGAEDSFGRVFFGTDQGLYSDGSTIVNDFSTEGSITKVGVNGTVRLVDIQGTIKRKGVNTATGNETIDVYSASNVRGDSLIGRYLYITDSNPVEKYDIVDNTSIDLSNEFKIEIDGAFSGSSYLNKRFVVVGETTSLAVVFDEPVDTNEFAGGTLYVSSNENDNYGTTYGIDSNTNTTIDLTSAIVPRSTVASVSDSSDIINGQTFRLVDSNNKLKIWSSFNRSVPENELIGLAIELTDTDSPSFSSGLTISQNGENNFVIDLTGNSVITTGEDVTPMALAFNPSDSFEVVGPRFVNVPAFNNQKTSTNLDHYHDFTLINNTVSGEIDSFVSYDASYVVMNVANTSNFALPVVQLHEDLFEDAKIVFVNSEGTNARFESQVVSHNSSSITVRTKSFNWWDFNNEDTYKISENWTWSIDASKYGYTNNVYYDDFVAISTVVIEDINRGDSIINVKSTAGMVVGDKIRLIDDTLSSQDVTFKTLLGGTSFEIEETATRTFFKKRTPYAQVLRDTFSNTHVHQVRDGVLETVLVDAYVSRGYTPEHSHRSIALIEDISSVIYRNGEIIVGGSSNLVYNTSDSGTTWTQTVDLNSYIEGGSEVDGVSSIDYNDNQLMVGATTGHVFVYGEFNESGVVPISPPVVS